MRLCERKIAFNLPVCCERMNNQDILPLNDKGVQQWPKAGDAADFVFLDASCSAEAVSRISDVKSLTYQGTIVF